MNTIPKSKLAYWRRLAAEATPAPWATGAAVVGGLGETVVRAAGDAGDFAYLVFGRQADRDFILTSREAVPALLAERDDLLALLRELGVTPEAARDEQDEAEWQVSQRER